MKLNPSLLEEINDDMEFCLKLAKEESVMVLPGKIHKISEFLELGRLNSYVYQFDTFVSIKWRKEILIVRFSN